MSNINVQDIIYGRSNRRGKPQMVFNNVNFSGAIASENSRNNAIVGLGQTMAQSGAKVYDRFSQLSMRNKIVDAQQAATEAAKKAERNYNSRIQNKIDPNEAADLVSEEYRSEVDAITEQYKEGIAPYLQGDFSNSMKEFNARQEVAVQNHVLEITDRNNAILLADTINQAAQNGSQKDVEMAAAAALSTGMDPSIVTEMMYKGLDIVMEVNAQRDIDQQIGEDPNNWESVKYNKSIVIGGNYYGDTDTMIANARSEEMNAGLPDKKGHIRHMNEQTVKALQDYAHKKAQQVSEQKRVETVNELTESFEKHYGLQLTSEVDHKGNLPAARKYIDANLSPDEDRPMLDGDRSYVEMTHAKLVNDYLRLAEAKKPTGAGPSPDVYYNVYNAMKQINMAKIAHNDEAVGPIIQDVLQKAREHGPAYMTQAGMKQVLAYEKNWKRSDYDWSTIGIEERSVLRAQLDVRLSGDYKPEWKRYLEATTDKNLLSKIGNDSEKIKEYKNARKEELFALIVSKVSRKINTNSNYDGSNAADLNPGALFEEALKLELAQWENVTDPSPHGLFNWGNWNGRIEEINYEALMVLKENSPALYMTEKNGKPYKEKVHEDIVINMEKTITEYGEGLKRLGVVTEGVQPGMVYDLYQDSKTGKKYWASIDSRDGENVHIYFQDARGEGADGPYSEATYYKPALMDADDKQELRELVKEEKKGSPEEDKEWIDPSAYLGGDPRNLKNKEKPLRPPNVDMRDQRYRDEEPDQNTQEVIVEEEKKPFVKSVEQKKAETNYTNFIERLKSGEF